MTDENVVEEDSETENIDELFKEETEDEVTEVTETEEETKGETEVEEKSETDETAPPAEEEPKLVPIAALHNKARLVQELREENEKLKGQIPQTDDKPDMYENPEEYEKWVESKAEAKYLEKQQEMETKRVDDSRSLMLESHQDYMEKEDVFMFVARNNQPLIDEMLSSPNPAQFAYEKGGEYLKTQEDTIRAKILAESSNESQSSETPAKVAPSLASATAKGTNSVEVEEEETLDDMFEDQKY